MGTTYDIGFGTHDMNDSEMLQLYNKLKTTHGVYESSYQVVMKYSCAAKGSDLSGAYRKSVGSHSPEETVNLPMTIQFLDDSAYLNIIKALGLSAEEYTGQNAKIIAVAKMKGRGNQEKIDQLPDVFASPSMNFTIAPETNGQPKTEYSQNVGITFVNAVPPDIPPMTETSEQRPYTFSVIAPYSIKEKLAPSDTSSDIMVKGMTFQSKNPS